VPFTTKNDTELDIIPVPALGPPATIPSAPAIANTGCTAHCCTTDMPVHNKLLATAPVAIRNPNGEAMCSTHTAELHLPGLPLAARQVHIVPLLASQSLCTVLVGRTLEAVHYASCRTLEQQGREDDEGKG
jgi:hypothetical protein